MENFSLKDKNFKNCFNIGSNWGPHLLVGRGERVDLVPLFGKWSQKLHFAKLA
jgi:hypothetical protein